MSDTFDHALDATNSRAEANFGHSAGTPGWSCPKCGMWHPRYHTRCYPCSGRGKPWIDEEEFSNFLKRQASVERSRLWLIEKTEADIRALQEKLAWLKGNK